MLWLDHPLPHPSSAALTAAHSALCNLIAPTCTLHIMCCTHLHLYTSCSAPTCTFVHHVLRPPAPRIPCIAPTEHSSFMFCTHLHSTHQMLHPTLPTLCATHTCAFMRPNSFQHGPSRFTRASFGLLPPRVPQLTSAA